MKYSKKFSIIVNNNLPACINCIHYIIKYQSEDPYKSVSYYQKHGKCKLFGKKNLVSGEIEYENAKYCREDDKLCGKDGKKYEYLHD
jgi:hypothetical protein